jgi:glycosyltransferase involved in cell wall biosynthesis
MNNKKAIIFSRNFPYNLGGAERSLLEELKNSEFAVSKILHANQIAQKENVLSGVGSLNAEITGLNDFVLLPRFFYYEYVLNRQKIARCIKDLNFDVLVTQNRWAPAAVNAANDMGKESIYYLRDETSLGVLKNYYTGPKALIRDAYKSLEYPGICLFNRDNERALNNASKVISNSNFMSSVLWDKYKVDSIVSYPKLNEHELIKKYDACLSHNDVSNDGIIMIGDNRIKGIDLFIQLAQEFPNQQFYIFGKNKSFKSPLNNIQHLGWSADAAYPFSRAKLVLVPSVWDEAFGRVAIEALLLKIPVVVANRGGLPEAVGYKPELIADGYDDFVKKIRNFI